jgi:sirohydrochlorin cobaltochelatase
MLHSMESGLILYAHGARDVRWTEPFEQLRVKVASRLPATDVMLAYLEFREPDLAQAASRMAERGVHRIRVVPLFFGRGGHLREDFPRQLDAVRQELPQVQFDVTMAAGEDDGVLEALAAFAVGASATAVPEI